jgi:hypothetical protein
MSFMILLFSQAYVPLIKSTGNHSVGQEEKYKALTVAAHDARNSSHYAPQERVRVDLMLGSIVDV